MVYQRILHLSDLHIRMGDSQQSRYDEYVVVIDRLLTHFATYDPETTLIVVTGDVFHDKSKIGPCAHMLATRLLSGLARMRTLVIRGNHDYRQDQPDEPDLIKPFFKDLPENLEYLDETGQWQVGNIEFGLVAVQETLVRGAGGGIVSTLPEFPTPNPVDPDTDYRIALFHGSVGGAKLQNGTDVEDRNNYPLTWFDGYDMVMLGDIHVQQIHRAKAQPVSEFNSKAVKSVYKTGCYTLDTTKSPWGYAGSLIQQNFGESLWGHGFVEWDLANKTITTYHVRNDYGMVVVALDEQEKPCVKFRVGRVVQHLHLNTVQSFGWFPKNLSLRFAMNARTEISTIQSSFETAGISVRDTGFADEAATEDASTARTTTETSVISDLTDLNSTQTWVKFFHEQGLADDGEWAKWIEHPHLLKMQMDGLPDAIANKIKERNQRLEKAIETYIGHRETKTPIRLFRIHYIEFANLLCYGPGNYINFDTFVKQVCLLNGNNGAGKSATLEIICLAIFGEVFPSRANKSFSSAIINQHKAKHESASTKICFSVNGKRFWINRVYEQAQKNARNLQQKSVWVSDDEANIINVNANMVDEWVKTNIGPFSQFLLTTIMSQANDSDFFAMAANEQKRIIDSLLNLTVCEDYASILKEANLGHSYILDQITTFEAGHQSTTKLATQVVKPESEIAAMSERLAVAEAEAAELTAKMAEARKGFSEVAEKVFQFPLNHYEIEATQLLNLEAPETELETLKGQRSHARDRMAVLRSKRYQPPLIPVTALYDFDTAEAKLLELRAGRQNRQARLYDSKAHATWQQRRDAWLHVNPLTTTTLTLKEAEKELRTIVAALAEVEVEGYEPVSERVLKGLEKTHNELTVRIQQIGGELRLLQREEVDLNRQLTPAILAEIKAYRQSLKTLQALFGCEPATVAEQMTRAAEIMRKQARNEEQLEDVALNLKELGSVVYNAACKACIANPYRLKKDNLVASEAALKATAAELEDALAGCFPETTTDDYDELDAAYKDYQQRSTDRVKTHSNLQTRLKAVRLQIEQLEAEKTTSSEQLEENDYEGQATANEYFRLKENLQLATTVAEAARYSEEEQEWETAKQQQQMDQKIQEAEKQAAAAYAAETRQLENDLRTAEAEIAIHETVARASARLAEIATIRKAFPHWQTYSQLDAKLRPLQAEIAATTASLVQARMLRDKLAETQNTAQQITIYRKYLSDRTLLIETMSTKFKEYSDWLYPNKVKPMLENAVNTVLKAIPLPRPISLVAEWENSVASWYVQDGTSRPPYEKASGAQRFFVSLALRLAFSRMGTSNMVNGQIFLDEGFTACDAETMEHIPGLLRSMLQQMENLQTIFIVSHLDTLKSAASTQIRIHRGAQNSSLTVGERVQTVKPTKQNAKVLGEDGEIASAPVIPVKKRGRPAKAIQVAE